MLGWTPMEVNMKWLYLLPILAASPAAAQQGPPLPRWDVGPWCDRVSAGIPSNREACMASEQGSYNLLKSRWDDIPARLRSVCLRMQFSVGVPSYDILDNCIHIETGSSERQASKEFRY